MCDTTGDLCDWNLPLLCDISAKSKRRMRNRKYDFE